MAWAADRALLEQMGIKTDDLKRMDAERAQMKEERKRQLKKYQADTEEGEESIVIIGDEAIVLDNLFASRITVPVESHAEI